MQNKRKETVFEEGYMLHLIHKGIESDIKNIFRELKVTMSKEL